MLTQIEDFFRKFLVFDWNTWNDFPEQIIGIKWEYIDLI